MPSRSSFAPLQSPATARACTAGHRQRGDQNQITLTRCTISDNTGGPGSGGGGIASQGAATLTDCTVSRNSVSDGGGIISVSTLTLKGSSVTGHSATGMVSAPSGFGGGIYNLAGVVTVDTYNNNNSLIAFNSATRWRRHRERAKRYGDLGQYTNHSQLHRK